MAVFKWRGGWAHDFRDAAGVRHRTRFDTREEAKDEERRLGTALRGRRRLRPRMDPRSTVAAYAARWLARIAPPTLKRQAYAAHAYAVRLYIAPRLGPIRLLDLRRADVKDFLTGCQRQGVSGQPLSRGSLRVIYSAIRCLLNAAIDDELVTGNVAAKLGRHFKLQPSAHERQAATEQRVLEPAERRALLEAARSDGDGAWYPLVLTFDRAGLRLGEGLALEVSDVRFEVRKLRVRQAINGKTGELEPYDSSPKHGPRLVDLSPGLAEVLEAHITGLEVAATTLGRTLGRWLFPSEAGTPLDAHNVRRVFRRLSNAAGLEHVTPQDLRHTFGSTLATTELPQYVQQQMGHRDINTTIGTYGSAFHARPTRGVALLDDDMVRVLKRSRGDKVVTLARGKSREVNAND
jgi:integrase